MLKLAVCLSLTIVNDFLLKALDANWLVLWYGSNVTPKLIREILFGVFSSSVKWNEKLSTSYFQKFRSDRIISRLISQGLKGMSLCNIYK